MNVPKLALIQPEWSAPPHVRAYSTTRMGGVSSAPYAGLNLGDHVGDVTTHVQTNRRLLRAALALPTEPVWLQQTHSDRVTQVDANMRDADGCIAWAPEQVCVVLTADCLPVLLTDRGGSVVAAAHAGWRGLCAGILEQTVAQMRMPAEQLMAWIGPAISARHFEVDDAVRAAFLQAQPALAERLAVAFVSTRPGHWLADLPQIAKLRLQSIGMASVFGGERCVYADSAQFYSYRREGVTGRMASLIWLEK